MRLASRSEDHDALAQWKIVVIYTAQQRGSSYLTRGTDTHAVGESAIRRAVELQQLADEWTRCPMLPTNQLSALTEGEAPTRKRLRFTIVTR